MSQVDLYRDVEPEVLHGWVKRLKRFRYCVGVHSGHMSLPEQLKLRIAYDGQEEGYLALMATFGIEPKPWHAELRDERGFSISQHVSWTRWTQPGWVELGGTRAFVWAVGEAYLEVALGDDWRVQEKHIQDAEQIEAYLATLPQIDYINPPEDSPRCFCPERFGELWASLGLG